MQKMGQGKTQKRDKAEISSQTWKSIQALSVTERQSHDLHFPNTIEASTVKLVQRIIEIYWERESQPPFCESSRGRGSMESIPIDRFLAAVSDMLCMHDRTPLSYS